MLPQAAMRPAIAPRPLTGLTGLAALLGDSYADPGTITGVTHDSRAVRPGDLYVALPGSRVHGGSFAEHAVTAGAVAVLTDPEGKRLAGSVDVPVFVIDDPRRKLGAVSAWVYGRPSSKLLLLGVTGTNGKTTTAYLMERGLAAAGYSTGLVGTVQTRIGDDVLSSPHTTPEATDLQATFAVMVERGVSAAAVEVSSHALAYGRASGSCYDVAVFTNLSQDHLDFHGDMESYFEAKATLFTASYSRRGVVNVDGEYGRRLTQRAEVPVATFSAAGRAADWAAVDVRHAVDGSDFSVIGPDGCRTEISVRLPGPFNVTNALGAFVALVECGVPAATAAHGVSTLDGVPGRMQRVEHPGNRGPEFTALVDYAHTPDAVRTLLGALRPVTAGNLTVVLGCGGDRDPGKRAAMGAAAAGLADGAVFTNDNPRSEDPWAILSGMVSGVLDVPRQERAHVAIEPDRAEAIALAVTRARAGDVVVVAGKGHERGQEVAGVTHPFDDATVLRDAVADSANLADGRMDVGRGRGGSL